MFDLHLCLSASVNVRHILHTQPLGLYNKILVGNPFVHHYFSTPSTFLLISSILQNGQYKEPQRQCCQPATPTDPRASFGHASSNAPNYAVEHGQHATDPWLTCTRTSTQHSCNRETSLENSRGPSH
jgi:hypothetical protein